MASNYQFLEPAAGLPGISATASGTPAVRVGLVAGAVDPTYGYAEFQYVQGASASAPTPGDACLIAPGFVAGQAVSGNTATLGNVGIAAAAISATNVYGWVQIFGVCDYANMATAGTGAVGAALRIGSTPGLLQTTAGATGYVIDGAFVNSYAATSASNSNKTSGVGVVQLFYPMYNGRAQ